MSEDIDTKIIKVNSEMFEDSEIEEACEILKKNGLVAFPTETVMMTFTAMILCRRPFRSRQDLV